MTTSPAGNVGRVGNVFLLAAAGGRVAAGGCRSSSRLPFRGSDAPCSHVPQLVSLEGDLGLCCTSRMEMSMLEFHPLRCSFLVTGSEFDALVEDIRRNGVLEPVVLHDGKILDGRNRCRAAEAAGCPYPTKPYDGGDPLGYVVSANIHRRHLNETQRAVLALSIERHEAEAAAQRMLAGKRNPEEPVPQGRARDIAAAAVGISGRTLSVVKAVVKEAPDLLPALTDGKLLAKQALREVNTRKGDERRAANAAKVAATPPLDLLTLGAKFSTIVADPPWLCENDNLSGAEGRPMRKCLIRK